MGIGEVCAGGRRIAGIIAVMSDQINGFEDLRVYWIGRAKAYGYVSADRHADLLARCKSVGRKLGKMIQKPDSFS